MRMKGLCAPDSTFHPLTTSFLNDNNRKGWSGGYIRLGLRSVLLQCFNEFQLVTQNKRFQFVTLNNTKNYVLMDKVNVTKNAFSSFL
jgi:hypothetical protein